MKRLYDETSYECSKLVTRNYSTSFSLGIFLLGKKIHNPIYAIYGFVRLADEIVDSFHDFDKAKLLNEFIADTHKSIAERISLNPILNAFQEVVHQYQIDMELVNTFLKSMEMDLNQKDYDAAGLEAYILGSAEVVGLMCLKVFVDRDEAEYQRLKPSAMRLGAAFQKVNFLRDLQADYEGLGRTYFPEVSMDAFDDQQKGKIEAAIKDDFKEALIGIRQLPKVARLGVYSAYVYYLHLFKKIRKTEANRIIEKRIRIPNWQKLWLTFGCLLKTRMNLI